MDKIDELLLSFSKKQYYKLLELEKVSQLNEETRNELRSYNAIAYAQINWEMRDKYSRVLQNYSLGKLNEVDLWIKLDEISESASELQKMMRQYSFVISPHLKCLKFELKIDELRTELDQYNEEYDDANFKEELENLKPYFEKFKNQLIKDSKDIIRLILEN